MGFRKDESGNVLVVIAMCMSVLVGFAGLALDVGLLYRTRQQVQTAADAGAVAAALSTLYGGSAANAQTAAYAATSDNGYQNGVTINGKAIAVSVSPVTFAGASGYSQVVVTTPNPTNFMRLFGFNPVWVSASAMAGPALAGSNCMYFPSPTGNDIIKLSGSGTIEANCGISVNSSGGNAVDIQDCGGANSSGITYKYLDVVGGVEQHSNCAIPVTTGAPPATPPWGDNLQGPSGCSATVSASTLNASSVVAGWSSDASVCFTSAVTLNNGVTLPGSSSGVVYVFENGLTINNGATVTFGSGSCSGSGTSTQCSASGAVMDIAGGTLSQKSNSVLNMYAPADLSSTYDGIAILQPPSNTNELQLQFGSSNETLDGYIYAPGAEVYLQDQGGGVSAIGMVAGSLDSKSTLTVNADSYDQANSGTTINRAVTLVE